MNTSALLRMLGIGVAALAVSMGCLGLAAGQGGDPSLAAARNKLIERDLIPAGITHEGVLRVMRETPRHEFIPGDQRANAYFDMALPIGWQQTISSPFIVAYMTQSLDPQPTDRVLEIGTGSGYQAAVLSPLVADVYTIEIIEPLGRRAARTLKRLGYHNVHVRVGDGYLGWPDRAPFDKIIVTCSPEDVPQPLVEQLREGGSMVIPVGERYQQTLYRYIKKDGKLVQEALQPTLFVPMTGKAERERKTKPDPRHPAIENGSFEKPDAGGSAFAGWYYERQVKRVSSDDDEGKGFVAHFHNETKGRASHLLQGFAVDGSTVGTLDVSLRLRTVDVVPGDEPSMQPMLVVSYYDRRRSFLGEQHVGPWIGTREWTTASKIVSVPSGAREALVRIGLFGATGDLYIDDVVIHGSPR